MDKINAIILAGTHSDKSKLIYGKNKAFLKLNNKPIVFNVLKALKNSNSINKIAIVGPKKLESIFGSDIEFFQESLGPKESRRFIENALIPYHKISPNGEKTLYIPCDLPFIASETIDNFILKTKNYSAAFNFGIINSKNIPREIEPFKKSAKFYLKNKGYYRTANMVLFENSKIKNREFLESEIEKAFPMRRTTSILSKLSLYGFLAKSYPLEILKYITNNLKEQDLENAFARKPGILFKLIETKDPRALIDIDYEEEYDYIKDNYQRLSKIYS